MLKNAYRTRLTLNCLDRRDVPAALRPGLGGSGGLTAYADPKAVDVRTTEPIKVEQPPIKVALPIKNVMPMQKLPPLNMESFEAIHTR